MSFSLRPLRPLPARAEPLRGESLISLARRTSQDMGYEGPGRIRKLLTDTGKVPTNFNLLSPGIALDRLAGFLRVPSADLQAMTCHRFAAQLVLAPRDDSAPALCDSKTVLRYFATAAFPVCPQCLREDSVPFERLVWSFRFVPICTTHRCLLVARCPVCRRLLRHTRNDVSRCPCGHEVGAAIATSVSLCARDLVETLKQVPVDGVELLPGMPAAAMFWWAERLAAATAKTPAWLGSLAKRLDVDVQQMGGALPWLAAAEILGDWPKRLEEFLSAFQQVPKHRTTSTGISRRFGLLLREATHLEQFGYAAPADALRNYLLQHYAAGHLNGKVCLFQDQTHRSQLQQRPWITQTEAAKQLRLRSGTIAPLVTRGILTGQVHSAGQRGRSLGLIARSSVESLRAELETALSVCAVAQRLGVGRHAVLDFVRDDVLPRAVRTAAGWKIPVQSVEELETLCKRHQPKEDHSANWVSLRQATRIGGPSGLSMSQIVKAVQAGSLAARMENRQLGLNGIVVSRADLATAQRELQRQRNPSCDWSLYRAARNLFPDQPMKPRILQKWIEQGLLPSEKNGRRTVIAADAIRSFRAEYCLAQEATRILGISRSTLSRWEQLGHILPVYGKRVTPGAGFSLYRRADLQRLVEAHS